MDTTTIIVIAVIVGGVIVLSVVITIGVVCAKKRHKYVLLVALYGTEQVSARSCLRNYFSSS